MAKRKAASRSGASRTAAPAAAKKPIPSWMVLALGLGLGALMTLLFTLKPGGDNVQREQRQANKPAPTAPSTQPKPKYEFYDMLSNSKVDGPALPDPEPVKPAPVMVSPEKAAEIDTARAMAALNGQVPPPRPIVAAPTPAPQAKPAPAAVAPKPAAPITPPTQAATPAPQPVAPTPAPQPQQQAKPQRFYLQAGSFRSRDDADRVRAQIILMGQDARVETGTVNGQTWYRVMSGPFNSREQMSGAQHSLSSAGFQSLPQQR